MSGICYIVATPIGNLEDITHRAIRILGEVDLIAAEDTRVSSRLLKSWNIETHMISFNAQSESRKIPFLINKLKEDKSIALISDAGTPGISDPGNRLVGACINEQIDVVPIPGPSALVTALSASGVPTDRFWFEGFLPHKKGRKTRLEFLNTLNNTVVLYESPHRLLKTLTQLAEHLGPDRYCVLGRELTKKFEEFARGSIVEVLDLFKQKSVKGEFVIMVAASNFIKKENIIEKK